jgi:hypothetical protein
MHTGCKGTPALTGCENPKSFSDMHDWHSALDLLRVHRACAPSLSKQWDAGVLSPSSPLRALSHMCTHPVSHAVQCLAHEPPLSAAHVARLLVQEAISANNKLPPPLPAPADPRDPFSDEDDREQSDSDRCGAATVSSRSRLIPEPPCSKQRASPTDCA